MDTVYQATAMLPTHTVKSVQSVTQHIICSLNFSDTWNFACNSLKSVEQPQQSHLLYSTELYIIEKYLQ